MNILTLPKENLLKYLKLLEVRRENIKDRDLKEWFRIGNQIRNIKKMVKKEGYVD